MVEGREGKNEANLLANSERVNVAVGDIPGEEAVGIFSGDGGGEEEEECTECKAGGS